MAVGPELTKLPYLAGPVTVTGTVGDWNDKDHGVYGDGFALLVDNNFLTLTWMVPGSGNCFHCETYPLGADVTNFVGTWNLPQKPADQPFTVNDGSANPPVLQKGDHIALQGFLRIETGHPQGETLRGLLLIGEVFLELHPFDWTNIRYVGPAAPGQATTGTVIAVAPLFEMAYDSLQAANKAAGVAGHLFVPDDGSAFHNSNTAAAFFPAPPKPEGVDAGQLAYRENVLSLGRGYTLEQVRTLQLATDGLHVTATVSVPASESYPPVVIGDVNSPADGFGIFVAEYTVFWTGSEPPPPPPPRITVPDVIGLVPGVAGTELTSAGLIWWVSQTETGGERATVIAQSPPGGSLASPGDRVGITVLQPRQGPQP